MLASQKQFISTDIGLIIFNRCTLFSKVQVETILFLEISYKLVFITSVRLKDIFLPQSTFSKHSSMSFHLLQCCLNFDLIETSTHSFLPFYSPMILLLQIEGFGNHVQFCRYYKRRSGNFMKKKNILKRFIKIFHRMAVFNYW